MATQVNEIKELKLSDDATMTLYANGGVSIAYYDKWTCDHQFVHLHSDEVEKLKEILYERENSMDGKQG
jgi:hypothetical protein